MLTNFNQSSDYGLLIYNAPPMDGCMSPEL
jgi:hypothetical protein